MSVSINETIQSRMSVELSSQSPVTPKVNEKKRGVRPSSESGYSVLSPKVMKTSTLPRATRSSQNPEFAAKQRQFLNRVHDPTGIIDGENSQESFTPISSKDKKINKTRSLSRDRKRKKENDETRRKSTQTDTDEEDNDGGVSSKKQRTKEDEIECHHTKVVGGVDSYCWTCHRDGNVIRCESCPRVYHTKCLRLATAPPSGYMCPECSIITEAEDTETRSRAMRMLTLDQLCTLLDFALDRMKSQEGHLEFLNPVDTVKFDNYCDYIVKPMDLTLLKANIKARMYGSTEAFYADAKWIAHNSTIFNSAYSSFTTTAKAIVKICRQEMQEIENCPDCYLNAHTRATDSWFIEACRRPHILLWAKLKSFPFWPAKAMATSKDGQVDVRFFGAHDRAWVPLSSCFLYSKIPPAPSTNKNKRSLDDCIKELENHVKKLKDKFGRFEYAPYKTPYDPNNEEAQLAMFLPLYEAKVPGKRSSRLSLHHDGARKSLAQNKLTTSVRKKSVSASSPQKNSTKISEVFTESTTDHAKESIITEVSTADNTNSTTIESTNDDTTESANYDTKQVIQPDMVSFPKPLQNTEETCVSKTPVKNTNKKILKKDFLYSSSSEKNGNSPGSKTQKIPLTAAAKKCFAMTKTCVKCKASIPNTGGTSGSTCSACSLSSPLLVVDESVVQEKKCVKCQSSISNNGNTCAACSLSTPLLVGDESVVQIGEKNKLPVENDNNSVLLTGDNQSNCEMRDAANISESEFEQIHDKTSKHLDGPGHLLQDSEPGSSKSVKNTVGEEVSDVDKSPHKFAIPQIFGNDMLTNTSKQVSSVCFAVEEAIKNHINTVDEEKTIAEKIMAKKTNKSSPFKIQEKTQSQVLIQGTENVQEMTTKIKETQVTKNNAFSSEVEMETSSDSSTEIDSEVDAAVGEICFNEKIGQGNKKKKEKHINNVVQSLTARKNSVHETREPIHNELNEKKSNSLMLDDTNNESSNLLINESGDSSNESKRISNKPDKSRRKGTPAKVCNRSSTSTESTASSPESKSKDCSDVLDEVNGKFRRSSEDSDVTIMLLTNNATPPKDTPKQIRSVNISKSLSISVVDKPSADLDMECLGSDLDDQNTTDSNSKNLMLKPTARKTFPTSTKVIDIVSSSNKDRIRQNKPNESHPPPLVNHCDQTTVYEKNKLGNINSSADPTSSGSKTSLGLVSAKMEEISEKTKNSVLTVLEEMLRECSEAGSLEAQVVNLKLEKEKMMWRHRQEIAELKHNADLQILENRTSSDADKQKALIDAKHRHDFEQERAVNEVKLTQWCNQCLNPSSLFCCWNTSYCSNECQQANWAEHMGNCSNGHREDNSPPRVVSNVLGDHLIAPPSRVLFNQSSGQLHEHMELEGEGREQRRKIRRCGQCEGCLTNPCHQCYNCTNPTSHSVCKNRRCSLIITKKQQRRSGQNRIPHPPAHPQYQQITHPPAAPQHQQVIRPNHVSSAAPQVNPRNTTPAIIRRSGVPFRSTSPRY